MAKVHIHLESFLNEFDQTFKVTKVKELFSGFDLCDTERSVKMCNVI